MFLRLFLFLSPPRTPARAHSLTQSHTPFRASPPPPAVPLTVLGVLCFARSSLLPPRPAPGDDTTRGGGRVGGKERWRWGVAWRVTPTHHEPGTGPASLQHAASPWRRPQPLSADVTSHPRAAWSARAARLSSKCQFASVSGILI